MMASSISGFGGNSFNMDLPFNHEIKMPIAQSKKIENKIELKEKEIIEVEEYVRKYFSDIPVMIEIAKCESRFRQYDKNGEVLRGEVNSLDRGVMQINQYYHSDTSDKLGYDLLTIEGNTAYARALYEKYGVKPWASSSRCWAQTIAYAEHKGLAMK